MLLTPDAPTLAKLPPEGGNKVLVALFFLAVVLLPFQNTILQTTPLRFLGASLSFVPVAIFCVYALLSRLSSNGLRKPEIYLAAILIFSAIPTLWGLVIVNDGAMSASFLIKKTFTNTILNILLLYPLFVMPAPGRWLERGIFTALALCVSGYILVDLFRIPGFTYPSLFQASSAVTTPRGFSLEQSTFGATIALLCLLAAVVAKRKAVRGVILALLLLFVFVITASKGTMLALIAAFGLAFIFSGGKNFGPKIMGLLVVCLFGFLISGKIAERFEGEFRKAGSVSTRSILMLSTVPAIAENPLGVGYSGYIPAIANYVYPTAGWLQANGLQSAGTGEIDSYIQSEDKRALNIKSQIFEYIMVFGIPGLILTVIFHVRLYRRVRAANHPAKFCLLSLYWFALISLLTYMPALGMYVYMLAYAVLMNVERLPVAYTREDSVPAYTCFDLTASTEKAI